MGQIRGFGEILGRLRFALNNLMMSALRAGVAKLVYAPDSKSGEVHSSCRFESDLRHHRSN
jgi:hypothetical protein